MSSPFEIVLVRHGERADKYAHLRDQQERNNSNLTESGLEQARGVARMLREQHPSRKYRVISSPFFRTIQTAAAIVSSIGADALAAEHLEVDFALGEHTKFDEIPASVTALADARAAEVSSAAAGRALAVSLTGSASVIVPHESMAAASDRVWNRLLAIASDHLANAARQQGDADAPSSLLIVTHGFAPARLIERMLHGVAVTHVNLLAHVALVPRAGFTAVAATGAADDASADAGGGAAAAAPGSPRASSPFALSWSRGLRWRLHSQPAQPDAVDAPVDEFRKDDHGEEDGTWYETKIVAQHAPFLAFSHTVDVHP